jgi:hypothetical protein
MGILRTYSAVHAGARLGSPTLNKRSGRRSCARSRNDLKQRSACCEAAHRMRASTSIVLRVSRVRPATRRRACRTGRRRLAPAAHRRCISR